MKVSNYIDLSEITSKDFYFFLFVSFLFCFPVIYGQSFHADDVARVYSGNFGWDNLGRYFAKDIAQAYSFNSLKIIDSSPLSWILSIFILSICACLINIKFNKLDPKLATFFAAIFICNPFFIHNLLYRFDNLGMSLAMFFTVFAFTLNNNKYSVIAKVIALVISLNFYQTFSNIFIGLVAIELLIRSYRNEENKELLKFILVSTFCFIIANALYFLELKVLNVPSRGSLLPIEFGSIITIYSNYIKSLTPFLNYWAKFNNIILIITPFLFIAIIRFIIKRNIKVIANIIISVVLIFISTIGLLALMKNQFISPRGLGYFPIVMMFIVSLLRMGHLHLRWIIIIPIFTCFVFSYRVGNINQIQTSFEKPILAMLTVDLHKVEKTTTFYNIGSLPLSDRVKNIQKSTPFNGFLSRGGWSTTGALWEYGNRNVKFEWSSEASKTKHNYIKIKNELLLITDMRPFYKLYTDPKTNTGYIVWQ